MKRDNFSSGTPWEPVVGYSRAVRIGDRVLVAGTTATDETGGIVGIGDPYLQTIQTLRNIERALGMAGATLADVVRTRVFVRDIANHWEDIGRAHGEYFRDVLPVSSMIEVSRFISDDMLVEIEVEAVVRPSA